MMNPKVTNLLYFVAGAAVGAFGMWLSVKKYYELKADLEVQSVKEAFEDKISEIEDKRTSVDGDLEGPEEIEPEPGVKPTVSSITKMLNNKPPLKDYSKMFKEKSKEGDDTLKVKEIVRGDDIDPAEVESPPDDEPYTEEEDENEQLDYEDHELNGEHRKALLEDRAPYLIELSDYEMTCANYEKQTLLYYICDDILTDESGDEISPRDVIGTAIMDSGFGSNDEDTIFVRNDKLMCDYEVTKVFVAYER